MQLAHCHHVRRRRGRRRQWQARALEMAACAEVRENLLNLNVGDNWQQQQQQQSTAPPKLSPLSATTTTTTTRAREECDQPPQQQDESSRRRLRKLNEEAQRAHCNSFGCRHTRPLWLLYLALASFVLSSDLLARPQEAGGGRMALLASANQDENRLYEDLMMTYNRIIRPVERERDNVVVRVSLSLSQLMEVNLKNQIMTISVCLNQEWYDSKLKWDPSEYGGITDISLPSEQIWLPDIVLYNSAEGVFAVSILTKASVHFDGRVTWNPPAIFRSSCQIDITYFPFDSQHCILKFGSWTHGNKMDLRHVNETPGLIEHGTDLSTYVQNVEWDIMRATAQKNVLIYECCPNDLYIDVTFNFTLRRKPLFYTVNLILPCVGITFFSFLVFYLPSDSGEKITLTISILVSLIFFLSVLIETIPSTSLAMPLLGKYLAFTMILVTLSVCATVLVLNVHFRTPSTHSMPAWIKRWCMDVLPKYLLMSVPQYQQSQQASILPEQLIYAHNPAYATQSGQQQQQAAVRCGGGAGGPAPLLDNLQALSQQFEGLNIADFLSPAPGRLINSTETDFREQQLASGPPQTTTKASLTTRSSSSELAARRKKQTPTSSDDKSSSTNNLATQRQTPNSSTARPQSILPYLHSDAARRLLMQRSRSSDRENRSLSDRAEQAASSTGELDGGRAHKRASSENRAAELRKIPQGATLNNETTSKHKNERRKKRTAPNSSMPLFWRLFKPRRRSSDCELAKANSRAAGGSSDKQQQQQQQGDSSQARARKKSRQHNQDSPSSSSSSTLSCFNPLAAVALRRHHHHHQQQQDESNNNQDDDYVHHRHFQARASICSNNLWRIGPTRRCSVAVPANYPTYYRPLAAHAGHQHCNRPAHPSGGGGGGVSAISHGCLQTIPANERSFQAGDTESLQSANNSLNSTTTDSAAYQSGNTVGALIQTAATSLLRPRQSAQNNGAHLGRPLTTSGGFIQANAQGPHLVGAMPPRQLETPSSCLSDSQPATLEHLPAPPPPLPAEFGAQAANHFRSQQQQQQQQQLGATNQLAHSVSSNHLGGQPPVQMGAGCTYRIVRPNNYQNQQALASSMTACPIKQQSRANMLASSTSAAHYDGQQQQQASLPRSRSTDHRLAALMARDLSLSSSNQPANFTANSMRHHHNHPQQQHHQLPPPPPPLNQIYQLSRGGVPQVAAGQQSIGRQLGQAYIQKLQRQPTVYAIQQKPPTGQKVLLTREGAWPLQGHQSQMGHVGNQRPGGAYPEPSIDMLRRSKSQTSLSRRTNNPGPHLQQHAADCQHCLMAASQKQRQQQSMQLASSAARTASAAYRPQSEMRGRFNSTGCRYSPACATDRKLCDDGFHCGPDLNHSRRQGVMTPQMSQMSIHQAAPYYATTSGGNKCSSAACRCGALKQPQPQQRPQPIHTNQNNALLVQRQPNASGLSRWQQLTPLGMLKLISEVDKAIQNAMFIAQHIDNLDEFESVKENWKYIAMVIDRIFLIIFLFACIAGTMVHIALVPWSYYIVNKPIDLELMKLMKYNLTSSELLAQGCNDF